MSGVQGPPPAEAPKQPHVDVVKFGGSQAHIFNSKDMLHQALNEEINIFDRADFGNPIERARLNLGPLETPGDEEAIGIAGSIQIVRSLPTNMSTLIEKFTSNFRPYDGKVWGGNGVPSSLTVEETIFKNCWVVVDDESGARIMVTAHDDGLINFANQVVASSPNDNKRVEIHAPAVHTVDAIEQLRGASRILMHTLDVANNVTSRSSKVALNRTYNIGEVVRPFNYKIPTTKALGRRVVQEAVNRSDPTTPAEHPEANNLGDLERELGLRIGVGEITLDDIGGLSRVKDELRDVATSFTHPEVMEKWGAKRPQGLIFYGEPGTGKTMLVEALTNEIDADLWAIQGSDVYGMWLGNSEANIKRIFEKARALTRPTVILFDEFDSIIGISEEPGPGGGGAARNGVAGIFKQEMNTLAEENPNVLVVATTNHLDRIDPALIRSGRFDHTIYVPMPDDEARAEIVTVIISKAIIEQGDSDFSPYDKDINIADISQLTDGMSGADISEIFRRIQFGKAMKEARSGLESPPITQEDIVTAIKDFRTQG